MAKNKVLLITGARKGIGRALAEHYAGSGWQVIGCSRLAFEGKLPNYRHYCLDVADEPAVKAMFYEIRKQEGRLDVLINNAGVASMNHSLLTPIGVVNEIMKTNFTGTFLFCREAARLMQLQRYGRIVNFATIAVPLKLEGEAVYAASKAAVISLTQILAREFADFGITVNAIGPGPIKTDLIGGVPSEKLDALIQRQAIKRYSELRDVIQVIDFFVHPGSDFVTGQVIFLGGV
jgi:Dehydrogenases with different specificities (related to short-chain alcohol dehydrogenases)